MKPRLLKTLKRFWPGLLCLVVVFVLLAWCVEPRPRFVASLPVTGPRSSLDHALSPDGKYLATKATGVISGGGGAYSALTVHELSSRREVFSSNDTIGEFRFDPNGSLAYLAYQRIKGENNKYQLQLHRWSPDTQQSQKVWEHEMVDPESTKRSFAYLGNGYVSNASRLSPDTQTLLFTTYQKAELHGELVDGVTGKVRNAFTIARGESADMLLPELESIYTSDSKFIVLQTTQIHGSGMERRWHWVDVQSGEVTKTVTIPNELIIEEILFATATTPMAKASNRQGDRFLVSVKNKEVQAAQFEETKPPATPPTEKSKLLYYVGYFGFPEHEVVFYEWYYGRDPGKPGYMAEDINGLQWAIRDLATDTLIHADKYVIDPTSKDPIRPQHRFVTMLSPRHLLFQENQPDEPGKLLEWLTKLRTWLGMDADESVKLLVVDGTSGRFLQQIHVPPRIVRAFPSRDGQILTVVSSNDTRIEVRRYDFPLRQPWLLICSWALGIAVGITMLVELRRWQSKRLTSPPR